MFGVWSRNIGYPDVFVNFDNEVGTDYVKKLFLVVVGFW